MAYLSEKLFYSILSRSVDRMLFELTRVSDNANAKTTLINIPNYTRKFNDIGAPHRPQA